MTTETVLDLSGYEVQFRQSLLGWTWTATAPDGSEVPSKDLTGLKLCVDRRNAEARALDAIKRHAAPERPMDGEELRRRVEGALSA